MLKNKFLPLLILVILLSSCAQVQQTLLTPTPSSGIDVSVTEGPMCPGPVAVGKNECPNQPYQATITVFDANNHKVSEFQTDTAGYFKLSLAPGTYVLHPESPKPLPRAADQTVTITAGQYTQVKIVYDTGMR